MPDSVPPNRPFSQNRWAGLKQSHLPSTIVADGGLKLPADALVVYAVLLYLHQAKMRGMSPRSRMMEAVAMVKVSQERLMQYTGFSINKITSGTRTLDAYGLISVTHPRKKAYPVDHDIDGGRRDQHAGQTSTSGTDSATVPATLVTPKRKRRKAKNPDNDTARANQYLLLKPGSPTLIPDLLDPTRMEMDREPLMVDDQVNVLPANRILYFSYPTCIVTSRDERWSLANLTGSEIKLYFCLCWLSARDHRREENVIDTDTGELRRLSGLKGPKTLSKALDSLQYYRRLIQTWPTDVPYVNGEGKPIRLELCDPLTGNPIVTDPVPRNQPANYRFRGRRRRPSLNVFSSEELERTICAANTRRGQVTTRRGKGELMVKCPFHDDDTPSLCANTRKNGCWYCHGCKRKGTVYELLAQLNGTSIDNAIESLAATKGIDIEYQDPDAGATIYQYKTEDGKKILKEVLVRIKNGQKVLTQRRPGPPGYGWINNADGVPPSLYHAELVKGVSTVCIVEGEKDADTVTNLELGRPHKLVVGVTSGGAASWKPEFAKSLRGKNVVLMPDNDEAGEQYAAAVRASLKAEGIEYREVRFGDVGCKDVSDFLLEHSVGQLIQRIGSDLVPFYAAPDPSPIQVEITL
jgi:CHC2 zinc finger/Toprim-like